ncbi:MAG: hypothetical protein DRG40_06375, partial [Deltaproteobacteria bacterium]
MRKKDWLLMAVILGLLVAGCARRSYFGVPNEAIGVPNEFEETRAAIERAEKSPGAVYCPERVARAKELASRGARTYWACNTRMAMALLARARQLAKEAELC